LAGIDFRIYYRPGTQNGKPDELSRRPEYRPVRGGIENQPISTILKEKHFGTPAERGTVSFICSSARLSSVPTRKWTPAFLEEVREAANKDPQYQEVRKKKEAVLAEAAPEAREGKENDGIELQDHLLYRKKKLWVPGKCISRVMESEHDTKVAGHMGQDKTIELI